MISQNWYQAVQTPLLLSWINVHPSIITIIIVNITITIIITITITIILTITTILLLLLLIIIIIIIIIITITIIIYLQSVGECMESFLSRCVPHIQFDTMVTQVYSCDAIIYAYRGNIAGVEMLLQKSAVQVGFAHVWVAYQHHCNKERTEVIIQIYRRDVHSRWYSQRGLFSGTNHRHWKR